MSPWTQDRFVTALDFAARAHGPQTVPGSGFPYVVHVTKVASEVLRASLVESFDVDVAMTCALLHDTLEDAGVTFGQLRDAFGEQVARGVQALTKNDALPKAERMVDSLSRLVEFGREGCIVKLADRITNLEPPPPQWSVEKRRAYLVEAEVIVRTLGHASPYLAARLGDRMVAYRAHC